MFDSLVTLSIPKVVTNGLKVPILAKYEIGLITKAPFTFLASVLSFDEF